MYPEQVERWRQASHDANEKPVLTFKEQKELERLRAQDQREFKRPNRSTDGRRRLWRRLQHCCNRRLLRSSTPQKGFRLSGERTGTIDVT